LGSQWAELTPRRARSSIRCHCSNAVSRAPRDRERRCRQQERRAGSTRHPMKCKAPKADMRRPFAAIAYPERRPRSLMAGSDEGAWAQLRRSVTRDPPRPPPCSFRFYRGNEVRHAFGCPCCDALAPPAPPGAVYTLREGRRIASDPCLGLTRAKDLQRELAEVGIGRVRHEHRIFVRGKRPAPAERSRTRGQSLSDRVALHRMIVGFARWSVERLLGAPGPP